MPFVETVQCLGNLILNMAKFLVLTLVTPLLWVLLLTPKSSALRCYNCVETLDPNCRDRFDNSTMTAIDCDAKDAPYRPHVEDDEHRGKYKFDKAVGCRKVIQEVDEKPTIVRQCAYGGENVNGLKRIGNKGVRLYYYQCDTDECNGAQTFLSTAAPLSLVTLFLSILIPFFVVKS